MDPPETQVLAYQLGPLSYYCGSDASSATVIPRSTGDIQYGTPQLAAVSGGYAALIPTERWDTPGRRDARPVKTRSAHLVFSHDGGETWTKAPDPLPAKVADRATSLRFGAHGDTLALAYALPQRREPRTGHRSLWVQTSHDTGRSWSMPLRPPEPAMAGGSHMEPLDLVVRDGAAALLYHCTASTRISHPHTVLAATWDL
ncbi:MAG TPA: sialidase family protein [bacterium]|nr:sialidase family protein [bacterium]